MQKSWKKVLLKPLTVCCCLNKSAFMVFTQPYTCQLIKVNFNCICIPFDHGLFLSLQVSSPCIFTWLWVLWARCWMSCQSCGYWLFATPCGSRADTSPLLLRTGRKFCTMYTVCFYVIAWTCLPPLKKPASSVLWK